VNETYIDLIPCKIHTIRQNYDYWKHFEGNEVALFSWERKPYRSKQKVFCVKRIVSVQAIYFDKFDKEFLIKEPSHAGIIPVNFLAKKDGFQNTDDFLNWFADYKPGRMAILHFTDFQY
jgi:hypothetical protein